MDAIAEKGLLSELPDGVLSKIQSQLPLTSLVRSRTVCRAWKANAEKSSFLLVAGFCPSSKSVYGTSMASCAYDPASNRWYQLRLPTWLRTLPDRIPLLSRKRVELVPAWGSGGMLVLNSETLEEKVEEDEEEEEWGSDEEQLSPVLAHIGNPEKQLMSVFPLIGNDREKQLRPVFPQIGYEKQLMSVFARIGSPEEEELISVFAHIGNPMAPARSWASLPPFPNGLGIWHVRGLLVDAVAKCFKLVVVNDGDPRVPTFVFDSVLGRWRVTTWGLPPCEPFHVLPNIPQFLAGQGVFVGTVLYCFTASSNLLAYDLERARWRCLVVAKPTDLKILNSNLINFRNRLLCAAFVYNERCSEACLSIWEMDFAHMAWKEVAAMPAPMFTQFRGKSRVLGDFNYRYEPVLQVVAGHDEVYIVHQKVEKIAALDMRHRPTVWMWLPSLPYKDFVKKTYYGLHPCVQFGRWMQD